MKQKTKKFYIEVKEIHYGALEEIEAKNKEEALEKASKAVLNGECKWGMVETKFTKVKVR